MSDKKRKRSSKPMIRSLDPSSVVPKPSAPQPDQGGDGQHPTTDKPPKGGEKK